MVWAQNLGYTKKINIQKTIKKQKSTFRCFFKPKNQNLKNIFSN